jgi:OPA family sugar phosphate sensor protein UhpC-like MFS transporter
MLAILKFLRSAPKRARIKDKKVIDKKYRYWRIRTLYSMYIGYAVFYFTRKSFTFAMPEMLLRLHVTKADLGLLSTLFYVIYGVSKFISGMISDRSSPRYFMATGLIATGIANILFGFSSALLLLSLFWCINAFFQGWGWPPCARLLTHWYSKKERGRWWGIWNTSHNAGGALIPLFVAGTFILWHDWQAAMFIPGIIAIAVGLIVLNRLRDVPTSLGLPPIEEYRNNYPSRRMEKDSPKMPILEILLKYIVRNKYIWLLAISYVLIYVVRTALNDWGAVYLNERGASIVSADTAMAFFEIGGFLGSLAAGWMSDID